LKKYKIRLLKYFLIFLIAVLQCNSIYSQDSNLTFHFIELPNDPNNIDVRLFRSINNNRTPFLNSSLTVTDKSVLPAALILPVSMFVYGRAKDKPYEENTGVLLTFSEAVNFALVFGIKNIAKRPRPFETLSNVNHKNVSFKDKYSFPSGHTSTAFTMATTFALRYPKYPQVYVPMFLWGLAVGYGRVYWGMHYPSDILGGAVLGSLTAVSIYSLRSEIIKVKNKAFREENKPDINKLSEKSAGTIGIAFFLSIIANEFFPSGRTFDIDFHPFTKEGVLGINCYTKFNF
jgi:membrane-associated phospholipid phosphatase